MSSLPFAALAAHGGFVCDPRFAALPAKPPEPEPGDPLTLAWEDGYAAGLTEAQTAARAQAETEASARERIELALARFDGELAEALRQKLFVTVTALCEAAIAPLALDQEALIARVARAADMLARADDDKRLRLHPDDLALVAGRLPESLAVEPDPALERGALRFETSSGGIEDGPAHWRRAIAEAIAGC
jgi:flagellar assembly protein FliH